HPRQRHHRRADRARRTAPHLRLAVLALRDVVRHGVEQGPALERAKLAAVSTRVTAAVLATLAFAPAAHAACPVTVSAVRGAAPLRLSFHAGCPSAAYRWSFGDGTAGDGPSATHAYAGGRFAPTLSTDSGTQRLPVITSVALSLVAPRRRGPPPGARREGACPRRRSALRAGRDERSPHGANRRPEQAPPELGARVEGRAGTHRGAVPCARRTRAGCRRTRATPAG